jgi:hypothetical protein
MNGTVRVRRCREVAAVVAKIQSQCDQNFTVTLAVVDDDESEVSFEGMGELAAFGVLVLDELLESLGPFALEAAVLNGEYENEPCELVTAPTAEAGAIALSHRSLNQIRPMLHELTAQARQSSVTLLRKPDG